MVKSLQSLELQGLKTFATITRLEFPGQITAIVGPNGSGKSNIADSIRWVLGEQSFSLLRAKRTEDLIFSGSSQKSRAGMASATITFNNESGWLPIDYSTVSISRRAYRDGQNEYLLNGQKVRLKEIIELLSQTGLSERTYTVIGQGLVDVALALKPDERRKFFEEAAGIGLYRSRKEESLRRLENTRKNLDRILDIMTEIKPRLRSLEKQAVRYEEFQRLRSDLDLHLREWYGFHWHQKQQDLRTAQKAYQDQERHLNTLRNEFNEIEIKVDQSRSELLHNRQELETVHGELSELHQQYEVVSKKLAIIDERQRLYLQQKGNLEIDIGNLKQEVEVLKSQNSQYEAEIEERLTAYKSTQKDLEQVEIKLAEVSETKAVKEEQLEAIRAKKVAHETEKVQLLAKLQEIDHRKLSLSDEKAAIEEGIQRFKGESKQKQELTSILQEELKIVQQQRSAHQEKLAINFEQKRIAQIEYQELTNSYAALETEQAKLSAQLDVLQQAESALSGYSEGSKTVVEASRKGRLPEHIEPLSKHILVDEKYERAVSSALGELADLLVVPIGKEDVVVEYLESRDHDRVALVSIKANPSKSKNYSIDPGKGIFGFLSDLVEVDESYQDLIHQLFSDILIVKDRKTAQSIFPKFNGVEKIVTLNGLVMQANGVFLSGQSAATKRIGRTRKQSEMQAELKQVKKKLQAGEEKKQVINSNLTNHQIEDEKLTAELQAVDEDYRKIKEKIGQNQEIINRIGEQITWHKKHLADIEEKFDQCKTLAASYDHRLQELEDFIEKAINDEHQISQEIKQISVYVLQQEVNHWQTNAIVAQNALQSLKQRHQDQINYLEEAQKRLVVYQSRFSGVSESLREIEGERIALNQQMEIVSKSIDSLKEENIQPLSTTNADLDKSVIEIQKLSDQVHQKVVIAERQFTQLQLELSRRNDQLDNLRERIEDDFGLVSLDYEQNISGLTPLPFDEKLVQHLPKIQSIDENLEEAVKRLKGKIRHMGAINPEAQKEYLEVKERFKYLSEQIEDLEKASKDLRAVIATLDELMEQDFIKTFKAVNQEFTNYFTKLFNGGEAKLVFSDEDNPVEGGVDIEARLPGRREQGLALLSGGERSLTAVALIFALLKVSPTPFCILDEVDAMLDESNVGRFIELLKELAKKTQFVIITHNRNTVQAADVIYGVTMGRDSTSQMISLKFEEVDDVYLE